MLSWLAMSAIAIIAYTILGRTIKSQHPVWTSLIYLRIAGTFFVYLIIDQYLLPAKLKKLNILPAVTLSICTYLSVFLIIDGISYIVSNGIDLVIFMFKGGIKFFLFNMAMLALSFLAFILMDHAAERT